MLKISVSKNDGEIFVKYTANVIINISHTIILDENFRTKSEQVYLHQRCHVNKMWRLLHSIENETEKVTFIFQMLYINATKIQRYLHIKSAHL